MSEAHTYASGSVVAAGNFDGVHLGHKALIEKAAETAKKNNMKCIVISFEYESSFIKDKYKKIITDGKKYEIIRRLGVDEIIIEKFDEIRGLTASEFIESLCEKYNMKYMVCSENHTLGCDRAGVDDINEILNFCGARLIKVPFVKRGEDIISSSKIREYITKGDIPGVRAMLGYDYEFTLVVENGKKLGRTLGFPTINQRIPDDLIVPSFGVYKSEVFVEDKQYPGVTNIGRRPSVDDGNFVNMETYIVGIEKNLYKQYIRVKIIQKIRDEKRFDTIDELKNAIMRDVDTVKKL